MKVVDVEELWTHGGSLRLYLQHASTATEASDRVIDLRRARG